MIYTYKRKRASLNTCSYYERLFGDSSAECSARTRNIEDGFPNERCSLRENEEAKCEEWSNIELLKNSNFAQSHLSERLGAPPVKFQYTRRPKKLRKSGRSLHHGALPQLQEESQSMTEMHTAQPNLDRLCSDSCSPSCRNDSMRPSDHSRCCGGSLCSQNSTKEENNLGRVCSNISANESAYVCTSILHEPDPKCKDKEDDRSCQNCVELGGMNLATSLQTYSRRSRNNEDTRRTYAALMAERSNFMAIDQSYSGSAGSLERKAVPKTIELGESEFVIEYSPFSPSLEKLTDGVSSVGNMICSQGNQKVKNGCRVFDDTNVSTIPSLNDEAVTDQQHDDAMKSHRNICDLALHTVSEESSGDRAMPDAYEAVLDNPEKHFDDPNKAEAASKDFSGHAASLDCSVLLVSYSDNPSDVDLNLAASTTCQEAATHQSEPLQQPPEMINDAALRADDPKASPKELLGIMRGGIKEPDDLFDINVQPSKDAVSVSPRDRMGYPVASQNESAHTKVLQLFPEDTTDNALQHNISKPGLDPAVPFDRSSVTMALPELSISCREFIQDKVVESSSSQPAHKLLLSGIKSCIRPQMETTEGFRQNFQPSSSFWCEEELDNLWVGVRRHGKDNWYAMLKDPRLRFSPWRTARDLAEKWITEQTKLLGNTPGPRQDQSAKPVGIPLDSFRSSVPPGPGIMTRFLTDPMLLSLSNSYLNKEGQGIFPFRPPHNLTNVPENGTRLFNRRVRAHRKSQRSETTWGRFKAQNQFMPPPQFSTSLPSTSRINVFPSFVRDALHYPHPLPPQPVPPLPIPHLSNLSQFHDQPNNNGIGSSRQNGFHLSNTITDYSNVAAFPSSQLSEAKSIDPKGCTQLINLETEASSEGTISDGDKPTGPTLISK